MCVRSSEQAVVHNVHYPAIRHRPQLVHLLVGLVHENQPALAHIQQQHQEHQAGDLPQPGLAAHHLLLHHQHSNAGRDRVDTHQSAQHQLRLRRSQDRAARVQVAELRSHHRLRLQHVPRRLVHHLCHQDAQNTRELQRDQIHRLHLLQVRKK